MATRQTSWDDDSLPMNHSLSSSHESSDQLISLELNYQDFKRGIIERARGHFLPSTTIREIIEILLEKLRITYITPDDIILTEFSYSRGFAAPVNSHQMTLKSLKIRSGSIFHFEPSITFLPETYYDLTITGPDFKRSSFKWSNKKTTLEMLLDHLIKVFSLESLERDRIHLFNYEEEIDLSFDPKTLLYHLNFQNHYSIRVEIIPPVSSSSLTSSSSLFSSDQISVQCSYQNETFLIYISDIRTIAELQRKIQERLGSRPLLHLDLFEPMGNQITIDDPQKRLYQFGITKGDQIRAKLRVGNLSNDHENGTSLTSQSLSLNPVESNEVQIIYKDSMFEKRKSKISLTKTIGDLKKEAERLVGTENSGKIQMKWGSRLIDEKDLSQRLIDFGIEKDREIFISVVYQSSSTIGISTISNSDFLYGKSSPMNNSVPVGLSNLGNTCYMNSALQCLSHAQPLTKFFLQGLQEKSSDEEEQISPEWNSFHSIGPLCGNFAHLLKNLWLTNSNRSSSSSYYSSYLSSHRTFEPKSFREAIGNLDPRFATADQQDVQEFMTFLLNQIHKELKSRNSNRIIKELFDSQIRSTIICDQCQHQQTTTTPMSFIPLPLNVNERTFLVKFVRTFGTNDVNYVSVRKDGLVKDLVYAFTKVNRSGLYYEIIVVNENNEHCDYESALECIDGCEVTLIEQDRWASFNRFDGLENSHRDLTIEECLREFCSLESLEDNYSCPSKTCQKETKATKQLRFESFPPLLVIQLKRFSHQNGLRQKIEKLVKYPIDGLDLTPFLSSSPSTTLEKPIYDLFAVSNHHGSIYGGHYTAYAQHQITTERKWFKFDDSWVTSVFHEDDIVSRDAYLLFYIKREKSE